MKIKKEIEFIKNSGLLGFFEQFDESCDLASFIPISVYSCNYTISNYMYVNTYYNENKKELVKHLKEEKHNFDKNCIQQEYILLGPDSFYDEAFFFTNKRAFNKSIKIIDNISQSIFDYNGGQEVTIKDFLDFIYRFENYQKLENMLTSKQENYKEKKGGKI